MATPRMDGTEAERLQWRVEALRETINDALTTADIQAIKAILNNGIGVDNENAKSTERARL
jgi:hypothetical protein